jgi:hypothetical protein
MMNKSSYWVKTLQNGLIGGGISLLLGVVGMSLAFGKSYIISGVITMGEIFVLSPFLFEAYLSVRHAPSKEPLKLLMIGGLTGLVGGAVLAVFILIGQVVNLRAVLVNVSPDLIALLTFHLPIYLGVVVLLAVSLATGVIAAAIIDWFVPRPDRHDYCKMGRGAIWIHVVVRREWVETCQRPNFIPARWRTCLLEQGPRPQGDCP